MISEEEATQVWTEIREAAGLVRRAGGNPVEILLWSRGKTLSAVREEIRRIVYGGVAGTEWNCSVRPGKHF